MFTYGQKNSINYVYHSKLSVANGKDIIEIFDEVIKIVLFSFMISYTFLIRSLIKNRESFLF